MKYAAFAILASIAATASAQYTISNNGTITCYPGGGAYCEGEGSNIIIRCYGTMGQAGNCWDNLAGEPGNYTDAACTQSSPTAGDASCEKDGVDYPGSGAVQPRSPFPTSTTPTPTPDAKVRRSFEA